jgi:hypothetical protein
VFNTAFQAEKRDIVLWLSSTTTQAYFPVDRLNIDFKITPVCYTCPAVHST